MDESWIKKGAAMAIRVLMKREVPESKVEELKKLLDRMRGLALDQPGYASGETLKRIDKPGENLVISKWKSLEAWQKWHDNPKREAVQKEIDTLLGSPTIYEIYDYD
jgi:heme-degrading monooxygenase HmoA